MVELDRARQLTQELNRDKVRVDPGLPFEGGSFKGGYIGVI